jgi:eukaryotic-like serine/threonine-protein kinase
LQNDTDVMLLRLDGKAPPQPLLQTKFSENWGDISPDGHWLAYQSDESGQNEIHVRPFPNTDDGHWQVTSEGGVKPVWAPNGRELFYVDPKPALMAVAVPPTPTFTHGTPAKLFDTPYHLPAQGHVYDVSRDGQKFLLIKDGPRDESAASTNLIVVLNWFEELKARVPTK